MPHVPVVVVGAGHCGLATSRHLADRAIDHVILERGEVAHSWRTQRWDSLRLLTPNWLTRLPGYAYGGPDPDGYMTAAEVVQVIDAYAAGAPVRTGVTVTSVREGFRVGTDHGEWTADAVVLASGACNVAKVPPVAEALPPGIASLTPADYRNPSQVPDGGVLVVGASASGVQIADELLRAGRRVHVAVGEHVRMPRRYRGADVLWWMEHAGVLDESYTQMDDLVRARNIPSMQLAGTTSSLDLNALVKQGALLHGKLAAIRDGRALFSGGLRNVCALADLKMGRLLDTLDTWAVEAGVEAADPPERFAPTEVPSSPGLELDLRAGEIGTVLWATGFRPDLSWCDLPVQNARGRLVHDGGATRVPGLYLMGMPFLRRRKSTLIDGARADAADVVAMVAAHLDERVRATA
ncbi:NAD(P)-binding domain-containing protein [Pseudonocardia sp.]|uniref:NAD(P)-binding domain-containing protein n=1 Tax=Pseudonocardia sp. TaxID=60912 RepID=UPI003D0F12C2